VRTLRSFVNEANRPTFFAASGGLLSVLVGLATMAISSTGGFALVALGILFWSLAGVAYRFEALAVRVLGVSLDARLMRMEHGEEFKKAAEDAPDGVLAAVIPLLRGDVASDILEIPPALSEKKLTDPELTWLRKDVNVTAFAIQRPGDGDEWIGGGRISEISLPAGTRLAVLGERDDIEVARSRLSQ